MRQRLDEQSDAGPDDLGDGVGRLESDPLRRSDVPERVSDRVRDWVEWFGPARLVTSSVAVVVVCVGAWFLVRVPPPPSEAKLPVASSPSAGASAPEVTLAVPTMAPPSEDPDESARIVVHVAGSVERPGVYELPPGSRVDDALHRAGGATGSADPGLINLAAPVVDGHRIYVPAIGEEVPLPPPAPENTDGDPAAAGPVDVNRATAEQLETLPGVGPATAAAIVTERERNGPFVSFDDLERVPGIGPAKLAGLVGLVAT